MKAITLWEPWASLVAVGHKRYETRSWPTKHRGPLAIHSSLRWTKAEQEAWRLFESYPLDGLVPVLGKIVAVVQLVSCEIMTDTLIAAQTPEELEAGDWSPGRWAWKLERPDRLRPPVAWKGRQGMWEIPLSAEELLSS